MGKGVETCQFGGRKGAVFLLPCLRIIEEKKTPKKPTL